MENNHRHHKKIFKIEDVIVSLRLHFAKIIIITTGVRTISPLETMIDVENHLRHHRHRKDVERMITKSKMNITSMKTCLSIHFPLNLFHSSSPDEDSIEVSTTKSKPQYVRTSASELYYRRDEQVHWNDFEHQRSEHFVFRILV